MGTCPQTPEIFRFGPIASCGQKGDAPYKRRRHATGPLPSRNAGSRPGAGCFSAERYPPQRQGPEYPRFVSWARDHDMPRSGTPGAIRDCWPQPYDAVAGLSCHAIGAKRRISSARPLRACRDHGSVRKPDEPTKSCAPGNRRASPGSIIASRMTRKRPDRLRVLSRCGGRAEAAGTGDAEIGQRRSRFRELPRMSLRAERSNLPIAGPMVRVITAGEGQSKNHEIITLTLNALLVRVPVGIRHRSGVQGRSSVVPSGPSIPSGRSPRRQRGSRCRTRMHAG